MTYNLQRKIKFTIARCLKHICTWEKTENEIENAKNNIESNKK